MKMDKTDKIFLGVLAVLMAVFILCVSSRASEQEEEKEIFHIFKNHFPFELEYSTHLPAYEKMNQISEVSKYSSWETPSNRPSIILSEVSELFEKTGYTLAPGSMYVSGYFSFYLFRKEEDICFVACAYQKSSLDIDLVLKKMSWKSIASSLRIKFFPTKKVSYSLDEENKAILSLFQKKGSVDFLNRIAIITNEDHTKAFYSLYDTEEQYISSSNIIHSLD